MNETTRKTLIYVLGAFLLLVFAGFSYSKFASSLTPYVSYEAAIASERAVQVAGGLEQGSSNYDDQDGTLRFTLTDPERPGETLRVRYEGIKPANFEDAISIVAIGEYDAGNEEFAAHDLLVKCPSKYQGVDGYEEKAYGTEGYDEAGSDDGSYGDGSYGTPSAEPAPMTTNSAASSG